jgi:UDP-N-acetylmuramoylalanine--D-glutamate ligase|tara:strand:- start:3149 stop:4507 length:1359 start_codon:yes stop_codon:yes gene_type:complete
MDVPMRQLIASNKLKMVVGIGATGLSVARHLSQLGQHFVMLDTRQYPPLLEQFKVEFPDISILLGELAIDSFKNADEIILSPGLSRQIPAIQIAIDLNIPVINDIELFSRSAKAPIIAITGSNGKSTVTTIVGKMLVAAGHSVGVGGNLGTPALELLDEKVQFYVLELSSFQLESIGSLCAEVAVVLNVSADHMDRYKTLLDYHQAKHRIFNGARQVVVNRNDRLSTPLVGDKVKIWSFGLDRSDFNGFGLVSEDDGQSWLTYGFEKLMPENELGIKGSHNTSNALAALALGSAVHLPLSLMLQVLRQFTGLPHRCQTIRVLHGVTYINDSKATNLGATLAAIKGLGCNNNIILIAGGQGKGQDFSILSTALTGMVRQLVLMGEAAPEIGNAVFGKIDTMYAINIECAVRASCEIAQPSDIVLLSPGCSSFDMFANFEDRGEKFICAVGNLR